MIIPIAVTIAMTAFGFVCLCILLGQAVSMVLSTADDQSGDSHAGLELSVSPRA